MVAAVRFLDGFMAGAVVMMVTIFVWALWPSREKRYTMTHPVHTNAVDTATNYTIRAAGLR